MKRTYLSLIILLIGSVTCLFAQRPTQPTTKLKTSGVTCNQATINWTNGNGDGRLVFMSNWLSNFAPVDQTTYASDSVFGKAQAFKNVYCVFNDSKDSSVTITNLNSGERYYIAIYEYNLVQGQPEYLNQAARIEFISDSMGVVDFAIDHSYQCLHENDFKFTNLSKITTGEPTTFQWDFGDSSKPVFAKDTNHHYSKGGIFMVHLTARSGGCKSTAYQRDTVLIPYEVDFILDTTAVGNDSIRCAGTNKFELINVSSFPIPPIYGAWDRSRLTWTTNTGANGAAYNFDFETTNYDTITVQLRVGRQVRSGAKLCFDSISKSFYIRPPMLHDSNVTINSRVQSIDTNSFKLEHSGDSIASFTWYFGNGDSSIQNPVQYSYKAAGDYTISCRAIGKNGCEQTYAIDVSVVKNSSIAEIERKGLLTVWPNPVRDQLHLEHSVSGYQILSLTGELIQHSAQVTKNIGVSHLQPGTYLLRLDNGAHTLIMKLAD